MSPRIPQRKRYFFAVEGESEQSFIRWIGRLAEERGLHIHLETEVIGGGGFSSLVSEAQRLKAAAARKGTPFKDAFVVVDSDRSDTGDWPTEKVRFFSQQSGLTVCFQHPNHEGVLIRMIEGNEASNFSAASIEHQIRTVLPKYQKGQNAEKIARQYSADDLIRMAKHDEDWKKLLVSIGLMQP